MKTVLSTMFFMLVCMASFPTAASDAYSTLENYMEDACHKDCVHSEVLLDAATAAAEETGLDFKLILAIVRVESSFQVHARNGRSVGLMQLHLRYHKAKFQGKHYTHPGGNVRAGALVMKECMDSHHNALRKASRCYNGGGDPQYYKKLLKAYHEVKKLSFVEPEEEEVE